MDGMDLYRENIFSFVETLGECGEYLELPSGSAAAFSCTPYAGENWALFSPRSDNEEISCVLEFFETMGAPFIAPHMPGTPKFFTNRLEQFGLTERKKYRAMQIFDPKEQERKPNFSSIDDFNRSRREAKENEDKFDDVVSVDSVYVCYDWARAVWAGFGGIGAIPQGYYEFLRRMYEQRKNKLYCLNAGGVVAATAMLHKSRRGWGLYYFATRPEMRRRGCAKRLLDGILKKTECANGQRLVLLATEEGYPFYSAYGFATVADIPIRSLTDDI